MHRGNLPLRSRGARHIRRATKCDIARVFQQSGKAMRPVRTFSFLSLCLLLMSAFPALLGSAAAQQSAAQEKRIALVVGNGAYAKAPLPTGANDAVLIAQTLQAAGFDVIGARDLDADSLRKSFRDFLQKVEASPADTVAFVYLAGYGVQLAGENYFIPVDSTVNRDTDIPVEGLRISDYTRQLAAVPLKASVIVLDAAKQQPFIDGGNPIASGLALVDPSPNMLIAFNAAPGTVAPSESGNYGVYAQALAEMIRTGGLTLPEVFDRVRLRVSENTKGAQIPWDAQKIQAPFTFFDRAPDAPPVQGTPDQVAAIRERPMRDLGAQDAYTAAIARDTMQGYEDFLAAYPGDPLARRVRAILAARREAITWRRTYLVDTPEAYWSYLRRYPRGPHAWDARRRLAILTAPLEPPQTFAVVDYDIPPPPPEEIVYVDRPVFYFGDPEFDFVPPPPPPIYYLPPPPPDFVVLAPPFAPVGLFILPQPVFVPIPVYCSPPVYVAPPQNSIIFNNIHNTTVINNTVNVAPRVQNNIATAAATGLTGVGPQLPTTLRTKAEAISSGQAAIPPNAFVNTQAKTSTKPVFPVSTTSTSTTTTAPPLATATKLLSGTQQGAGTRQGTGTQQGAPAQGAANLKPGNALPGSPAQAGKGNEASKGGAPGTTGPGGVTPNTKPTMPPSTTSPTGAAGTGATQGTTPGTKLSTSPSTTPSGAVGTGATPKATLAPSPSATPQQSAIPKQNALPGTGGTSLPPTGKGTAPVVSAPARATPNSKLSPAPSPSISTVPGHALPTPPSSLSKPPMAQTQRTAPPSASPSSGKQTGGSSKSMATAPPPPSPQPASKSAVMPKLERAAPPRMAPPPPQPRIAAPSPPPRSAAPPPPPRMAAPPPPPPRMAAPPPPPPRMAAPPPPPPRMAAPAPPPRPAGKQCPPNVKCG